MHVLPGCSRFVGVKIGYLALDVTLRHHKSADASEVRPRENPSDLRFTRSHDMGVSVFRNTALLANSQLRRHTVALGISRLFASSMAQHARPRRFAPLDPTRQKTGDDAPLLKGIVFDVDGTLCKCRLPTGRHRINRKQACHKITCSQRCGKEPITVYDADRSDMS